MVEEAEALLEGDPDVIHATTYVGQGSVRFWLGLNPQLPNPAFAETVILSRDTEARERIKARLETAVADGALSGARVRVDRFNFGPPVGHPVQFRVVGDDAGEVRRIAEEVRDAMAENPNVRDPHLQWNEMAPAIRLVVDQDRARALGLAPQDIAETLQTLLTRPDRHRDARRHRPRRGGRPRGAGGAARRRRLGDLTVATRDGVPVPLAQVARIEPASEEPILWRRNRDLMIAVRADIVDGVQAPEVTAQILPALEPIKEALPAGYRIETGGAIEESEKGNGSIFAMFPIMLVATLTILMLQLQSFSRLAIVLITAPLGIIGASLALNVFGAPFGFVALLGQIALAGMIMRNSVILVDQIEVGRRRRPRPPQRHRRGDGAPGAAGAPDRARRDPRDDPAVALGLLGPDGDGDHGRPPGGDAADALLPAGALRALVPRPAPPGRRHRRGRGRRPIRGAAAGGGVVQSPGRGPRPTGVNAG